MYFKKLLLGIFVLLSLPISIFANVSDSDLASGIVSVWNFDSLEEKNTSEGLFNYYNDSISNNDLLLDGNSTISNNAIINNSSYFPDYQNNANLRLENSQSLVNWSNVNEASFSVWVNVQRDSDQVLFSHYEILNSAFHGFSLDIQDQDLAFLVGNGDGGFTDLIVLNDFTQNYLNQWVHIFGVIDDDNYKFYIDGNLASSYSNSDNISQSNDQIFIIGNDPYYSNLEFQGYIDEGLFFNEIKSSKEVQELYNRQVNNLEGSQYPFDSGEQTQLSPLFSINIEEDFTKNVLLIVFVILSICILLSYFVIKAGGFANVVGAITVLFSFIMLVNNIIPIVFLILLFIGIPLLFKTEQ